MFRTRNLAKPRHKHNFARDGNDKFRAALINYISYMNFETRRARKLSRVVGKRILRFGYYYRKPLYPLALYFVYFPERGFGKFRAVAAVNVFDYIFYFLNNSVLQIIRKTKLALFRARRYDRFGKLFAALAAL